MKRCTPLVVLALLVNGANAKELVGIPRITDGDTVVIGETKIRLLDMDAPESDQFCLDKEGKAWNCGIDAREALKKRVKEQEWRCQGVHETRRLYMPVALRACRPLLPSAAPRPQTPLPASVRAGNPQTGWQP
jgi:endonuclease YncB( thermonuclease family)